MNTLRNPNYLIDSETVEPQGYLNSEETNVVFDSQPKDFRVLGNITALTYTEDTPEAHRNFLDDRKLDDFNIDEELSKSEIIVAFNNLILVIAFRTSYNIVDAIELSEKAIEKHPDKTVYITGHLEGAKLAYYVGKELNKQSYGFGAVNPEMNLMASSKTKQLMTGIFGNNHLYKNTFATFFDSGKNNIVKLKTNYSNPDDIEQFT